MKTILYIHGFNGNPTGGTYEGLIDYFKDKSEFKVISYAFKNLHTDVEKTQKEIEHYIEKDKVDILLGASLGGFYTLTCKNPVLKIAINPCMLPSKEIIQLKDRDTGKPVEIEETVLNRWTVLENYQLPENSKNAFGIFGKDDPTFHYENTRNFKPLFEKIFQSDLKENTVFVEGVHSLTTSQIRDGLEAATKYFGL